MAPTKRLIAEREEEEEEEEERMKRIFDLVPRRKRSLRKPIKDPQDFPDFSKVPRRKRTDYTNTPPKSPQEKLLPVKKIVDNPIHILDKTLDLNDVDHQQNNLLMPLENLIRNDFLTSDETRIIEEDYENDGNMGVASFLVDQRSKNWNVVLRKRFLRSDDSGRNYWSYMLRGEWSDVVKANGLKDGDKISVWSSRYRGILCFSLAPPPSSVVVS